MQTRFAAESADNRRTVAELAPQRIERYAVFLAVYALIEDILGYLVDTDVAAENILSVLCESAQNGRIYSSAANEYLRGFERRNSEFFLSGIEAAFSLSSVIEVE